MEGYTPLFAKGLFSGQVVLVTGGGTGIGKSTAWEIGQLGGRIAICGRRLEPLQATAAEFQKAGIEVFFETCDIRNYEAVAGFVSRVIARFGRLDVVVNNAGGQFPIAAENLTSKGFDAVVRNNLLGTWNVTHACAKLAFIPQQSGRVVNVIAQVCVYFTLCDTFKRFEPADDPSPPVHALRMYTHAPICL
eukprot:TRINITY_DN10270_c0_g1_i2.p2 TRINITY_DN10270_c0_g1~~TRINITY_DN10270_c0_g1_i2.p2  ORF type:complete len:191 (+),score=36.90 TRINITY_DN10270_c0_g1_i2:97-669(+)